MRTPSFSAPRSATPLPTPWRSRAAAPTARRAAAAAPPRGAPPSPAVPAPQMQTSKLQRFLPPQQRRPSAGLEPAAVLGLLAQHLLEPARAEARDVLGFPGTKFAARAAQVGMLTVVLLMLSSVTGLGFALSMGIIVAVVGGLSAIGIISQRMVAQRRLAANNPRAEALRQTRAQLVKLEVYLTACAHAGDLHITLLQQTRQTLAQLDATWMHLLKEAVTNAKLPLVTLGTTAMYLLARSRLGIFVRNKLVHYRLLPKTPARMPQA